MTAVILELPREGEGPEPTPKLHIRALDWLWQQLSNERDRFVLWLPAFVAVGIGLYFALPAEPPLIAPLILGALIIAPVWCIPAPARALLLPVLAAIWVGVLASVVRTQAVTAPVLSRNMFAEVTGRVRWREPLDNGALRLVIDVRRIGTLERRETPRRVRVSLRGVTNWPEIGDLVTLKASLSPPSGPVAPGGYDYQRVAWFKRVGAIGYGGNSSKVITPAAHVGTSLGRWFAGLRVGIEDRIGKQLPPHEAAIATALLVGARGNISRADNKAMQNAGVSHVLSISGFHFALIAGMIFFVVRGALSLIEPLALRWPLKKIAAVVALIGSAFYVGLSDGSTPVIRSFIMFSVAILALLIDRPAISLRTVAFAAAILLLISPESLLNPSFEMSFAAVIGLVAAYEWWRERKRDERGPRLPIVVRAIVATALTSLVAEISTSPFAAYHFNQFQAYGLLGNEIIVPLLSFFIMPLGVIAVLLMPFGLEHWPLKLMGWGIDEMLKAAHWTAELPGAVTYVSAWPAVALLLMVFGGLWLALWRRRWRLAGVPVALVGLLIALVASPPDVFIGKEGDAMAFRTHDDNGWVYGLYGVRPTSYRGQVWLKGMGVDPTLPLKASALVKCDALGCILPVGRGLHLSVVRDGRGLFEECGSAEVLVSLVRVRGICDAPKIVLDPDRLKQGAAALRLAGGHVSTRFAEQGARPWRHGNAPKSWNDD